jgi:hypothetical protein
LSFGDEKERGDEEKSVLKKGRRRFISKKFVIYTENPTKYPYEKR